MKKTRYGCVKLNKTIFSIFFKLKKQRNANCELFLYLKNIEKMGFDKHKTLQNHI